MADYRWSVRNVDRRVIALIREVAETSGHCYGELLGEAIIDWYENLPEAEEGDVMVWEGMKEDD